MKNVKIVIGANFGDEGKGQITDYFVAQATQCNEKCIVVCHNGGAQRGHTVEAPNGMKHVFHHFGSGTLIGADTFLTSDFIVNPLIFRQEYEELLSSGIKPNCYIDKNCKFTFPYDMFLNQVKERNRGKSKHGSCGLGLYETMKRNQTEEYSMDLISFYELSDKKRREFIYKIMKRCLKNLDVWSISAEEREMILSGNIINNFLEDFEFMISKISLTNVNILNCYETIIFEGGQGLLLDMDNVKYYPNLTPSKTGLFNPILTLEASNLFNKSNVEVCYVTRSYVTRHGAGKLENECLKDDINRNMFDETNTPNPFQDTLRYGYLNKKELVQNIFNDFKNISRNVNCSLAITHLNETNGNLATKDNDNIIEFHGLFDEIYLSDGKTRDNIRSEKYGKTVF